MILLLNIAIALLILIAWLCLGILSGILFAALVHPDHILKR